MLIFVDYFCKFLTTENKMHIKSHAILKDLFSEHNPIFYVLLDSFFGDVFCVCMYAIVHIYDWHMICTLYIKSEIQIGNGILLEDTPSFIYFILF